MARASRVCNIPGCPTLTDSGRCTNCAREAARARGTNKQRGYGREHQRRFRSGVLARDPSCVLCGQPTTVADHHPLDRRQLVANGLDPDDPRHGRGLCASCHGKETAANPNQRGGWNNR